MAFEITKTYPNGVAVTYWEVAALHYDYDQKLATVQARGYVSKEARAAGASPYCTESFPIDFQAAEADMDQIQEKCYGALKARPEFSEATTIQKADMPAVLEAKPILEEKP